VKSDYFKNIIWAVDTIEGKEFQNGPMAVLGALARSTQAAVEPVHILNPPYATQGATEFREAFQGLAEKRMFELCQGSDIPTMSAGKVLINPSYSSGAAVKALIDYAEKRNADAIVVATHAKTGIPRFFLGSFAESLLLKSTVPVLTVNPATKVRERISKILFPTTFRSPFRSGFNQAARLAKILDARLTVLYKEPALPIGYATLDLRDYIVKEAAEREKQAKEWQDWAARFNVPVDIHLDNVPGNVPEAIDSYAREKDFDLIVMVSQADPVLVTLAGSMARQMVRSAPCPVLVMRAEPEE
jgi:nucleotide-binding universal stress UspA family protein